MNIFCFVEMTYIEERENMILETPYVVCKKEEKAISNNESD